MGLKTISTNIIAGICNLLRVIPVSELEERCALASDSGHATGYNNGFMMGKREAKLKFAVLPLPFTVSQLRGREYGQFVTPVGFGTVLGECTVPAPGPHGYEQRAYYVSRDQLELGGMELVCHHHDKFEAPADSSKLVPVIVTVLR